MIGHTRTRIARIIRHTGISRHVGAPLNIVIGHVGIVSHIGAPLNIIVGHAGIVGHIGIGCCGIPISCPGQPTKTN